MFLLEQYKKGCPTLLLIVSVFFYCIINHAIFTGIKEQPLYYTQDSVDQEFVKGTVGIGCFCSLNVSGKDSEAQGNLKADITCSLFNKSGVAGTSAVAVGRDTYTRCLHVDVGLPDSMVAAFYQRASPTVLGRDCTTCYGLTLKVM